MPLRLSSLLQFWGGVTTSLAQDGPPDVQPGTAAENCQRIINAGYSPHDYIYRVVSYRNHFVDIPGIDYFHYTRSNTGPDGNTVLWVGLASTMGGITSEFRLVGGTFLHANVAVLQSQPAGNYSIRERYGDVLTAAGEAVEQRSIELNVPYQGLDAYIWRPADGSADITYRDEQAVSESHTRVEEAGWFYTPDWDGPDAARMSSIWGDASACSG